MDELLHHCLRELAFDGDLGSNVLRLRDFISDFYARDSALYNQNPDDPFCAYVWSLLVQQSTIIVGVVPEGITSEVWIAPQVSAKRKATARGTEHTESHPPPKLAAIIEPKETPLATLKEKYGARLRIAAELDVIFAAITGSHIRSSKLSPMVYTALQIITRGRDAGVSVVDLGKQSGYDQKTCFYIVRQLTELELVLKVRRGGVGTHFVIHKYFYERCSSWKAIREEEHEAESLQVNPEENETEDADEIAATESKPVNFTPIDARHLSSYPLISQRIIKLLRASKNHIHASKDMLIILGFSNPTKTDRRFFKTRINEMIQQGLIEKVIVPNKQKKSSNASVKCLRLIESDSNVAADNNMPVLPNLEDNFDDAETVSQNGIKLNATIHKQIIDLVEESSTKGMTLNDLSTSLHDFDKRTIELLLARSEKNPPPSHLLDFHIVGIIEINGRERRHRYYTIRHYRQLVNQESLDNETAGYNDLDIDNTGGFAVIPAEAFYDTAQELARHTASFKSKHDVSEKSKKARVYKNPILPDGKVKRGRPRKDFTKEDVITKANTNTTKRKNYEEYGDEHGRRPSKKLRMTESLPSRNKLGRGRPRKKNPGLPTVEAAVPKHHSSSLALLNESEDLRMDNAVMQASDPPVDDDKLAIASSAIVPLVDVLAQGVTQIERESTITAPGPLLNERLTISTSDSPLSRAAPDAQNSSLPTSLAMETKPSATLSGSTHRVNVSHLRRENEFMRLLENAGGIITVHSKEFHESHMKLLEELSSAGEQTSVPVGTKTDKRTMISTFTSLERKGRVKQLKTSIATPTGLSRPAGLVYLPNVDEVRLNAYLSDLGRSSQLQLPQLDSFVKINEQIDYGSHSVSRALLPLQLSEMGDDEEQRWCSPTFDEVTARDSFLTERTTMVQLYGFIMGRSLRCRQLHLAVLEALEHHSPSSSIVSHAQRIVEMSFLVYDLPLDLYCSLVNPDNYDENLLALLSQEGDRKTLVRDLPANFQNILQVGRSRARSRFLEILDTLRQLNLVTPLQPSKSSSPYITCASCGRHPTEFDIAGLEGWSITMPALAPSYWLFHESAPIHLWAASETDPPLWKRASVSRHHDGIAYWKDLQNVCMGLEGAVDLDDTGELRIHPTNSTAKSLRRTASWRSDYSFTWRQTQYLKQFMEVLDVSNSNKRETILSRISWVTSAPRDAVERFLLSNKEKHSKNIEKMRARKKRSEEARVSLAKKSEEARLQREQNWTSLLSRCHPNELPTTAAVRIERIHRQFLHAGSIRDADRWERDIQAALRETDLASSKGLKMSTCTRAQPISKPASVTVSHSPIRPQDLPLEKLIEMQGPPIEHNVLSRKRKRKTGHDDTRVEDQRKTSRRHRFQWNPDFDELARDASVIIRARCRNLARLDWSAFEQVFPAVPRNTVRQRLVHIKETPGNEAYLRRLEEVWYALWIKHGGTEELPDDNPNSPSNFDLLKHIRFLRTHVDKHALRVGIAQTTEKQVVVIPSAVQQLHEQFEVIERERLAPEWDYIWNASIEEGREKKLKRQAFSRLPEKFPPSSDPVSNDIFVAESAVKMVMGTPPERYDSEQAAALLKSRGDEGISTATRNLLNHGILSKLQRDPKKPRPGRSLKISESNQNAIGGNISPDTFQDATLLLEEMDASDSSWHEWPLIATDGDCMALIQLVAENKVDFRIDTSLAQASRPALDWNSKKADDDHIETVIGVQYHLESQDADDPSTRSEAVDLGSETAEDLLGHGLTDSSLSACCRRLSANGLVDCAACLSEAWNVFCKSLDANSRSTAEAILTLVRQSNDHGIRKFDIINLLPHCPVDLSALLCRMLTVDVPLIYWTGYESLVLISAHHVAKWSVVVSQKPLVYIFPRRWLDIRGQKVVDFWQAAVRAVMSTVIFRPGMPQSDIRWRLRTVYDRQEIIDILRYLANEGYLHVRYDGGGERAAFFPYDEEQERQVYWFVGGKHWYQV